MNTIHQHTVLASLQQALAPAPDLIDSRTEKDWLCLMSRFARLINFYNNENKQAGNWEPFLLKDPVFLLAEISNTNFTALHTLYLDTCAGLGQQLQPNADVKDITASFNQLFDVITVIFMHIKRWMDYMQRSEDLYDLKTYIITEVKSTFSQYFWAILSLRQNLYLSAVIPGIAPVDTSGFYQFQQYNETAWKQNKDRNPYWQVLALNYPIKENTVRDFFTAITSAGDKLFRFFQTIVRHADASFTALQKHKSHYPDTTLLRGFINMLQIQQQQMNGIAERHLRFYYNDILHQQRQPFIPDQVMLYATLAKKDASFCLHTGTVFNAGLDTQKKPVLFAALQDTDLNPATIVGACTLTSLPVSIDKESLFVKNIAAPGLLNKDENGKLQTWETFGGSKEGAIQIHQGIAFASPLLLLREGKRTIILTLRFSENVNKQLLQEADYWLSTRTTWVRVKVNVRNVSDQSELNQAVITINLQVTDPAIEAFTSNPDGIYSDWPMLKVMFSSFDNLASPPAIIAMNLEVWVAKMKSLQLCNDYGSLSTKSPFPLFGPAPAVKSNFIIGSNEVFSKPLTELNITIKWEPLPKDFAQYYQQYNTYLFPLLTPLQPTKKRWFFSGSRNADPIEPVVSGEVSATSQAATTDQPFSNDCFKVGFQLLQNQSWTVTDSIAISNSSKELPGQNEATATTVQKLFFTEDSTNRLSQESSYNFTALPTSFTCEPALQLVPLKFSNACTSGFIKMSLTGPDDGFGATVYPAIVARTTYANAYQLYESEKHHPKDQTVAKTVSLPFTPKATSIELSYTAVADCLAGNYPFQCFQYAPFGNYIVYNGLAKEPDYQYAVKNPPIVSSGIYLYPPQSYKNFLFLELTNVVPAASASLYFELTGSYTAPMDKVDYFYISSGGWKSLQVLSDSTKGLNCSGIVTVSIPADISDHPLAMQGNNYWISIATNREAAIVSQTVLVTTNGFMTQRISSNFLATGVVPELPDRTITKPQFTIPQIATVFQPFPSFGGQASEGESQMNLRVSTRLKTKDRVVSIGDYSSLIRQQFPEVFFTKTILNNLTKKTGIYAITSFKNWTDQGAFLPLLPTCRQIDIQQYLQERTSVFANVVVLNFTPQYVQVVTTISIEPGYEFQGIQKRLNHILNLFFSPWIKTSTPQVTIDQKITKAQVARLIRDTEGVAGVETLGFRTSLADLATCNSGSTELQEVTLLTETALFVSCMNHIIQCIATV